MKFSLEIILINKKNNMSESVSQKKTSNVSRIAYTTDGEMYNICLSNKELEKVEKSLRLGIQIEYIKKNSTYNGIDFNNISKDDLLSIIQC